MQKYKNKKGNSGVVAYQMGTDFIKVKFKDGNIYKYTFSSAGNENISKMKELAMIGEGLSTYISTTVKDAYEIKVIK